MRVVVQGLCTVAQAAAPLCAGFPRCGRRVCGRWVSGRGGFCFLFGSGECLRFSVSGVGAGVGPCVFGCWLVLLPSLALFGGLPLDPEYAVPAAEKKSVLHMYTLYIVLLALRAFSGHQRDPAGARPRRRGHGDLPGAARSPLPVARVLCVVPKPATNLGLYKVSQELLNVQ